MLYIACYSPLKGFDTGNLTANGKSKYLICSNKVKYIADFGAGLQKITDKESPGSELPKNAKKLYTNSIDIPCGKCIGCRLDYSRQWADRCVLEAQYHKQSYFVTLTYDDDHIPINSEYVNYETGQIFPNARTLRLKDLQDFFKRLRINYQRDLGKTNNLRYYACGEYGDKYGRPHYHCIIFGLELDDLKDVPYSRKGYKLYESPWLSKTWGNGIVRVGEVTWETCAYTARYILKKQKGETAHLYEDYNKVPEFVVMSRKPGIAFDYFKEHGNYIYETDEINIVLPKGGKRIKPPRYYDNLFDIDHHDKLEEIKEKRKMKAISYHDMITQRSDLPYYEILAAQGRISAKRALALKRGYEGGNT